MNDKLKVSITGVPVASSQVGGITGVDLLALKNSPHVKRIETKVEIDNNGDHRNVLVVYTDVQLDCLAQDFDDRNAKTWKS